MNIHAGFPAVSHDIATPFEFRLGDVPADERIVTCEHVKRILPGRRLVCSGSWKGRRIVAKVFVDPRHAERDWRRECSGAEALASSGLNAPSVLHAGRLEGEPFHVVLYQEIVSASQFRDAWLASDNGERVRLLSALVRAVAGMHAAGLIQNDLHLDNFLLRDDEIYILDAGDVEAVNGKRSTLDNLALLGAQFPPEYDSEWPDILSIYADMCGMSLSDAVSRRFMHAVTKKRRYRKRKFLKKIYRECTAISRSASFSHFAVLAREYDSDAMRQLVSNPDRVMSEGGMTLVKDSTSSTIARGTVDGHALIIKRYNIRGLGHRLSRALRRTRASISWKNAHLLMFLGIPTARPIAMREERFGLIRGRSYLIMEALDGPFLYWHLKSESMTEAERVREAGGIVNLFRKLQVSRISHGDMKASNMIVHNGQSTMIDLDSMREYKSESRFSVAFQKDLERFFRNWEKAPELHELFVQVFHDAGMPVPGSVMERRPS